MTSMTAATYGRAATERRLEKAALELITDGGLLAGITMQQVGNAAGVAKSLVYHYFGDRQALLRSALRDRAAEIHLAITERPYAAFDCRIPDFFNDALNHRAAIQLTALLILDHDPRLRPLPLWESSMADLARDMVEGRLAEDADLHALLGLSNSLVYGYVLFREGFARQLNVDPVELDTRIHVHLVELCERVAGISWDPPLRRIPRLPKAPSMPAPPGAATALENAALEVLEAHGILAGLNLHHVAENAGVNRGLIYHYFGSRRGMLLSALRQRQAGAGQITRKVLGDMLFAAKLQNLDSIRLMALLALDGDEEYLPFGPTSNQPEIPEVFAASLAFGHALYRKPFARELGRPSRQHCSPESRARACGSWRL